MSTCDICMENEILEVSVACAQCNNSVCNSCYLQVDKCPFCRYTGFGGLIPARHWSQSPPNPIYTFRSAVVVPVDLIVISD